MHPHSYAIDYISQSKDLASSILSSTSPPQITSCCASIDSFLRSHSPDHSRHFFSLTFPTLICKLYGFDDSTSTTPSDGPHYQPPSSNGWVDVILQSNDADLANTVFNLLSPNSVLFQSISTVDRHSQVKYVFPIERLPEWARYLLSSKKDCEVLNSLCPLFRGKVKEDTIKGSSYYQVRVNVFEYFMFWFAYYPISKANCENSINVSAKRSNKINLANWTSSIPVFSQSKRVNEQKLECNLYIRLLYAYLCAFVPELDLNSHNPYRSSILNYGVENDGSVRLRAEFFVDMLVHYWLVDNDFSPLPISFCKPLGLFVPLRSVLGETPPTPGLCEVVKLLVKHLNLNAVAANEGFDSVDGLRWSAFDVKARGLGCSVVKSLHGEGSWNSWIQRPLYRFILRTLLFCPIVTSTKNASQVFSVWVSYMEPWKIGWADFSDLDDVVNGSRRSVQREDAEKKESGYTSLWEDYVLSNYLYYSSLVMHFIGFAHKFLHTEPEAMVQMVLQVIKILTSCKELTDLIKNVDTIFHAKQIRLNKPMHSNVQRHIPSIREKLEDWEDGLCESDADGSFLHENWNKDLKLFSSDEDGGHQLLQLFVLRAQAELQANSGEILGQSLQYLDELKECLRCLFGGHVIRPIPFSPDIKEHERSRDEIFAPRKVGNKAMTDVKYKGDWMKRPISDDEIAWLAKLLVRLSTWLNDSLGRDQAESSEGVPKWSYVDIPTEVDSVCGSTETMKIVMCGIVSWFLMLGATVVRLMRKHGIRVNLRILASKKVITVLFVCALFSILKKAFTGLLHGL